MKAFLAVISVISILIVACTTGAPLATPGGEPPASLPPAPGNDMLNPPDDTPDDGDAAPPSDTVPPSGISAETLASHASQDDCWIGYEGKAYDITEFLPKHPGSAGAIAPYCGTDDDFAAAFERKHGKSKVQKLLSEGVLKGDLA